MTESTAVRPSFRVSRRPAVNKTRYACRQCNWEVVFTPPTTQTTRLTYLAKHLTEVHGRVFPSSVVKAS